MASPMDAEKTAASCQDFSDGGDSSKVQPSPEDPSFLESLPEPLKSFALAATTATDPSHDSSFDVLEIQLRQEALKLIRHGGGDALGELWKDSLLMCWHMIFQSEQDSSACKDDERSPNATTSSSALRKIPIVLLEDILESSTLDAALKFFEAYVQPNFSYLFGPQLWWNENAKHARPCWLPFLKLSTNFWKRLSAQPVKYQDAVSSLMLTLCQIYPLSEKSATRVWGSYNDAALTDFEDKDEFEKEQASGVDHKIEGDDEDDDDDDDGAVPDYTVYESFWRLQQDFQRPNSVHLSDFLQRLRSLITTLEHTVVKTTTAPTNTASRIAAHTHRYLTSSRLLPIQLQDIDFRTCVLTQVLIVCHHLIQISPVVLKAQLSEWQNRAHALLQGSQQEWLQTILDSSEEAWRQWKRDKGTPDLDQRQSESLVGRKRKWALESDSGGGLDRDDGHEAISEAPSMKDLPAVSRQMRSAAPTLQNHLEEYVEALDPESGIEAEYHPKNNALFSWRAMRLLSAKHLVDMHRLPKNGDFETVVRTVYPRDYGIEIPGQMPEIPTHEEEEEELKEEPEESHLATPSHTEEEEKHDEEKHDEQDEHMQNAEERTPLHEGEQEDGHIDVDETKPKDHEDPHNTEDAHSPMMDREEKEDGLIGKENHSDQDNDHDNEDGKEAERTPTPKREDDKATERTLPPKREDDKATEEESLKIKKEEITSRAFTAMDKTSPNLEQGERRSPPHQELADRRSPPHQPRSRQEPRRTELPPRRGGSADRGGGRVSGDHVFRGAASGDRGSDGRRDDRGSGEDHRRSAGVGGDTRGGRHNPRPVDESAGLRKQSQPPQQQDWHRDDNRRSRPSSRAGEDRFSEERAPRSADEDGHRGGTGGRPVDDRRPQDDSRTGGFGPHGGGGVDRRGGGGGGGVDRRGGAGVDRRGDDHGAPGGGGGWRGGSRGGGRGGSLGHRGDRGRQRN